MKTCEERLNGRWCLAANISLWPLRGVSLLCGVDFGICWSCRGHELCANANFSSICTPTCRVPQQYTSETYLRHYLMYTKSCPSALCRRCYRVGIEREWTEWTTQDLLSGCPPHCPIPPGERGGETDKRFSVLCLTLMMSVCPDECVCLCVCVTVAPFQPDGIVCVSLNCPCMEGGRCFTVQLSCPWSPTVLHGQWTRMGRWLICIESNSVFL